MKGQWLLRKVSTDRDVGQYKNFHEAMEALAMRDGEWSANWSLQEIRKGDYRLSWINII